MNTGVGSHPLLQGVFLTQGLNLGLLHCRQILYHLSHQGSPKSTILQLKKKKTNKPVAGGNWKQIDLPLRASSLAVSFPMPVLAPVTTATFPGSWTVDVQTPLDSIFLQTEELSVLHFLCLSQRFLQQPHIYTSQGWRLFSFLQLSFYRLKEDWRKENKFSALMIFLLKFFLLLLKDRNDSIVRATLAPCSTRTGWIFELLVELFLGLRKSQDSA